MVKVGARIIILLAIILMYEPPARLIIYASINLAFRHKFPWAKEKMAGVSVWVERL